MEHNLQQEAGYGEDSFTRQAVAVLKQKLGREDLDIHLFAGGTQTNLTTISALLRPHEAVISASTGHICVHETGAIEATGHKIIAVESADGKLRPVDIRRVLDEHGDDEHMVKPKLVYVSNSTEIGTVYSKEELTGLSDFCRVHDLLLFMDGARLGSALCSPVNDLEFSDLPALVDAFYIGGTKNGALIGEALVLCREELKAEFRYIIKQKGALLAKGRLLGIQFRELFRDELFFELARHANKMAAMLTTGISQLGGHFLTDSPSNQIFPILPNGVIHELETKYAFYRWAPVDEEHSAIRLVTSWATPEAAVNGFLTDLQRLMADL